jgi:hypothetical protein
MLKKYLFVDLDDSLFQSPGKCPPDDELRPAAYLKDGSACSFTTRRQRSLFASVGREMTLIPATARNQNAFSRVDLPFASYAILDYGGIVLAADGSVDPHWHQLITADMAEALPGLHDIMARIDAFAASRGSVGRSRLIEDFATPFYMVIKDPAWQEGSLATIEAECVLPWLAGAGSDYHLHRNGNNLAVLPKTLNKARAVAYLCERLRAEHGEILTFGLGDSRSDARFMAACDYAIIPRGSQLAALTLETL